MYRSSLQTFVLVGKLQLSGNLRGMKYQDRHLVYAVETESGLEIVCTQPHLWSHPNDITTPEKIILDASSSA